MSREVILRIAPAGLCIPIMVMYALLLVNLRPSLFAVELKSLRAGMQSNLRVGYFSLCGGTYNDADECIKLIDPSNDTPVQNRFQLNRSADFQRLVVHGELIRNTVLTYLILFGVCFFSLQIIFMCTEWAMDAGKKRKRPNQALRMMRLICAYGSLFFATASAGQVQFGLPAMAVYNGVVDVSVNVSQVWQGMHWAVAGLTLLFHILCCGFHELHKPLNDWARNFEGHGKGGGSSGGGGYGGGGGSYGGGGY